ncbi:MAG: sigma-70 family RNA polymerase sigma factor [Patescibacteria group bacterium]
MITDRQMRRQRIILGAGYTDFNKRLNRYARSKTNDEALAEDLTQKTFLKTWTYLVKGGKIETMEAFLYHILKALIVDEYRRKKSTSLDVMLEKGFEPSLNDTHRLEDMLDGEQAATLIAQLPMLYQRVMRLRYMQDLSLQEISLITGQTKNAIAVQTHRGLEKLKELYESNCDSIGNLSALREGERL